MYDKLEKFLSKEKLKPYFKIDGNKIIDLFVLNLNISSELYKILQIFELSTRNIFNEYLSKRYSFNWINRKDVLSGNNGLNNKLYNDIQLTKNSLKNNNYNNNAIIANLSLGFWVNLLSFDNNDKIWQPSLKKIFNGYTRNEIQNIFRDIKDIRNRIAHHETIIFKNIKFTIENLFDVLKIYSNDLYEWTNCNINKKIFQELDNLYQQPCLKSTL